MPFISGLTSSDEEDHNEHFFELEVDNDGVIRGGMISLTTDPGDTEPHTHDIRNLGMTETSGPNPHSHKILGLT